MAGCKPYGPPSKEIRLVLLGKTGNGKSRTGNSILGLNDPGNKDIIFMFGRDSKSVTSTCSWKSANRFGKKIDVVDTPGVFDTGRDNAEVQIEVKKSIGMTTPGMHAVILCIQVGRFTKEDIETLNHFVRYFGDELFRFAVVVFTQVDKWEKDLSAKGLQSSSTENYIKNLPENLRIFLEKCSNRYVFFNNRLTGEKQEEQVKRLIDVIDSLIVANNNKFYTDEMYEKAEYLLEEEMKKNNMDRDEVKNSETFFKLLSKLLCVMVKKLTDFVLRK